MSKLGLIGGFFGGAVSCATLLVSYLTFAGDKSYETGQELATGLKGIEAAIRENNFSLSPEGVQEIESALGELTAKIDAAAAASSGESQGDNPALAFVSRSYAGVADYTYPSNAIDLVAPNGVSKLFRITKWQFNGDTIDFSLGGEAYAMRVGAQKNSSFEGLTCKIEYIGPVDIEKQIARLRFTCDP
jgi:hypothetical protein